MLPYLHLTEPFEKCFVPLEMHLNLLLEAHLGLHLITFLESFSIRNFINNFS